MWIKRKEYVRLKGCERMNRELEQEVKRLADLVSAEVKDCRVGAWCGDCKYVGRDRAEVETGSFFEAMWTRGIAGEVQYCKKHLHDICPEFELDKS